MPLRKPARKHTTWPTATRDRIPHTFPLQRANAASISPRAPRLPSRPPQALWLTVYETNHSREASRPHIPPDTILSYQPRQRAGWTEKLAKPKQEIEKVLLRLETSIGEGLSCGAR